MWKADHHPVRQKGISLRPTLFNLPPPFHLHPSFTTEASALSPVFTCPMSGVTDSPAQAIRLGRQPYYGKPCSQEIDLPLFSSEVYKYHSRCLSILAYSCLSPSKLSIAADGTVCVSNPGVNIALKGEEGGGVQNLDCSVKSGPKCVSDVAAEQSDHRCCFGRPTTAGTGPSVSVSGHGGFLWRF